MRALDELRKDRIENNVVDQIVRKIVKENGLNFDEVIYDVKKFIQKKLNKEEE